MRRLSSAVGELRRISIDALSSMSGKQREEPKEVVMVVEEPKEEEDASSEDEDAMLDREERTAILKSGTAGLITYKVVYNDGAEARKDPKASADVTGETFDFGEVLQASARLMPDASSASQFACLPSGRGWVPVQIRSIIILKDMVNRTDILSEASQEETAADLRKNRRRVSQGAGTLITTDRRGSSIGKDHERRGSSTDRNDGLRRSSVGQGGQIGGGLYIDLSPKGLGASVAVDSETMSNIVAQLREEMAQRYEQDELAREQREREAAIRKNIELQRRDAERAAEIEHINQRALASSIAAKDTQVKVAAAVKEAQAQTEVVVADLSARIDLVARKAEIRIQAAAEQRLLVATSALENELRLMRERESAALAQLERARVSERDEKRHKLAAQETLGFLLAAEAGEVLSLSLLEPPLGATFYAAHSQAQMRTQDEIPNGVDGPAATRTLQIEAVEPNGAAQRAGLAPGDLLVGVRERPLLAATTLLALLSDPAAYPLTLYFRRDQVRRRKMAMLLHLERRAAVRAVDRQHEEQLSLERAREAAEWEQRAYESARQRWELDRRMAAQERRDEERERRAFGLEDWRIFEPAGEWWREERERDNMAAADGLAVLLKAREQGLMEAEDAHSRRRGGRERERLRRRVRRLQGRRRMLEELHASDPAACRAAGLQGDGPLRGYPHTWLASTALGQLADRLMVRGKHADARHCLHRALDVIHLHAPAEGCELTVVFAGPPMGLVLRQGERQGQAPTQLEPQRRGWGKKALGEEAEEEEDESRFRHLPCVSELVPKGQAVRLGVTLGCRVLRVGAEPSETFEGVVDALMLASFPLSVTFRRPDWDDGWLRWDSDGEEEQAGCEAGGEAGENCEDGADLNDLWDTWTAEVLGAGAAGDEGASAAPGPLRALERHKLATRLRACEMTEPGPALSSGVGGVELLGVALENWAEICSRRGHWARAEAALGRRLALLEGAGQGAGPESEPVSAAYGLPRVVASSRGEAYQSRQLSPLPSPSPSRPARSPVPSSPSPKTLGLVAGSKRRRDVIKFGLGE